MPRVAKVAPVVTRKVIDTGEMDQGNAGVLEAGEGSALVNNEIEVVDPARFAKEKADNLAFNEEPVTVRVHETNDQNAPKWVEIEVNGKKEIFWRGVPKVTKRKFVEGLCRCKPISYKNIEFTDAEGNRAFKWPSTVGLEFPFEVVEDKNPKGPQWLAKLLREPV